VPNEVVNGARAPIHTKETKTQMKGNETIETRPTPSANGWDDFHVISVEFEPHEETNTVDDVALEVERLRERIWAVALKGYAERGRGYVYIATKFYAAALSYNKSLDDAAIEYITPGAKDDEVFFTDENLPDYDPEAEAVFVVYFYDGLARGVVRIKEAMATQLAGGGLAS
jgi:hypothetical protein